MPAQITVKDQNIFSKSQLLERLESLDISDVVTFEHYKNLDLEGAKEAVQKSESERFLLVKTQEGFIVITE